MWEQTKMHTLEARTAGALCVIMQASRNSNNSGLRYWYVKCVFSARTSAAKS